MIPESHPRYESLMTRKKMEEGVEEGIVHITGLIAHGRGEAFDYLIGEKTQPFAERAERVAAHMLMNAEHAVISVNGNTAILVAEEIVKLAKKCNAAIEVNLFHRSEERIRKIISLLKEKGAEKVFGLEGDARIEGLEHDRAICSKDGIYSADVVLVPLEDGDRCRALKEMGKKVIAIDLNPLSRTSRTADVTIVDNVTRAIPNIIKYCGEGWNGEWDNIKMLDEAVNFICSRLKEIHSSPAWGL